MTRGPGWFTSLGHAHASFYMGVLHGIAGSSHFLGVLPALALPSNTAALAYVAAFGMGSIVAMTAFASLVGLLGTQGRGGIIPHRALMYTSGVSALLVGGFWLLA